MMRINSEIKNICPFVRKRSAVVGKTTENRRNNNWKTTEIRTLLLSITSHKSLDAEQEECDNYRCITNYWRTWPHQWCSARNTSQVWGTLHWDKSHANGAASHASNLHLAAGKRAKAFTKASMQHYSLALAECQQWRPLVLSCMPCNVEACIFNLGGRLFWVSGIASGHKPPTPFSCACL
jgi:hypothetical protein